MGSLKHILSEFEIKTFANKKNIERAASKIETDEELLYLSPTNAQITTNSTRKTEKLPGVIVLTSKRVFFTSKVLLSHKNISIPLVDINTVETSGNGLTGGIIELDTSAKHYIFEAINYKKEIIQKVQSLFDKTIRSAKNPQVHIESGTDEISKLFELKEKGILTEDEFEAKKKQILGI